MPKRSLLQPVEAVQDSKYDCWLLGLSITTDSAKVVMRVTCSMHKIFIECKLLRYMFNGGGRGAGEEWSEDRNREEEGKVEGEEKRIFYIKERHY